VYRIREVDGEDDDIADTLDELHDLCFLKDAPRVKYDYGHWWLAYCGKDPVGFAGITPSSLGPGIGYLKRIGVLPEHRGQGLAARLTKARERCAKRNGWTRVITDTTDNVPSANNMIKAGYRLFEPPYGKWAFERSLYWTKELG
jgi:GNAT superfamily N-acetyltransferase